MSRPNKCIKDENGNEYWISRSSVVIPVVFYLNEETGEVFTLLEKRGLAVTHPHEWCCPCGYLDWDEDFKEACLREVKEETGLELNPDDVYFQEVRTDKDTKNQTIDFWFMCWTFGNNDFDINKVETKDEIEELRWLKVGQFFKYYSFFTKKFGMKLFMKSINEGYGTWAFKTHHKQIAKMLKKVIGNGKIIELDE